jgi:hypothetical protein
MCLTAVNGKQVRNKTSYVPQKEEDLISKVIKVYINIFVLCIFILVSVIY